MDEKNKPVRKEGRTILISSEWVGDIEHDGIQSTHQTDGGARFVIFDTIDNAKSAFENLKDSGAKVKYSYYKIFFRLSEIDLVSVEYDEIKEKVKNMLATLGDVNVLYFKFYTKNGNLMGSGDLTVDTKESLDLLISNDDNDFGEGKISFYRYRVRKNNNSINNKSI
jgi:hypothetical protein